MQKRQRFTAEFKREAVRLLKAADKPAALMATADAALYRAKAEGCNRTCVAD